MNPSMDSIEARFALQRGDFTLDVGLTIPARGVTALFGPSGCGKTTLLRLLAGLERSDSGYLRVGAAVWQDAQRFVPTHRRPLGYVFQEASLFPHLNVAQNLRYGYSRTPLGERKLAGEQVVDLLGLASLLSRPSGVLSGGERQRVAIARALLTSPRLLLMDEPLSALDAQSKAEILPFLERLHQELSIPVVYVSHAAEEVARLADQMVLMAAGRVVASGAVGELFTRTDLPLLHSDEAAAVLEATVVAHDSHYHLTQLDCGGVAVYLPKDTVAVGQRVRLRILARDVSIAIAEPAQSSILNVIPATVIDSVEKGSAQVVVRLQSAAGVLLACITRKSAEALQLRSGQSVYAQVKGVALIN